MCLRLLGDEHVSRDRGRIRRGQERRAAAAAGGAEHTVKQSRKGWKGRRYQRMEIRGDFL